MTDEQLTYNQPKVVAGVTLARLYIFGVLYLFFLQTGVQEDGKFFLYTKEGQIETARKAEIESSFWERLGPYDGQFYLDIANNGYRTISSSLRGDFGNYAFFPLLPMILAALRWVFSEAYVIVTVALTFVAGVIGTLAVWKLAQRCGVNVFLAVAALICFPSAPFQYILYTEGLTLCLTALTLVFTLERRLWPTLILGLLAGLCRPQGVLLAVPIFVEFVLPHLKGGERPRHSATLACLAACAPALGFVVMALVSEHAAGSPMAFLSVQSSWGRTYEAESLLKALVSVFGYDGPPLDLLGILVGIGCIPLMWKRLPLSLTLYGVAAILMPLATGSILSFGRFMSISIPHMLALAIVLEARGWTTRIIVLVLFLLLQATLMRGLVGWYFVG